MALVLVGTSLVTSYSLGPHTPDRFGTGRWGATPLALAYTSVVLVGICGLTGLVFGLVRPRRSQGGGQEAAAP